MKFQNTIIKNITTSLVIVSKKLIIATRVKQFNIQCEAPVTLAKIDFVRKFCKHLKVLAKLLKNHIHFICESLVVSFSKLKTIFIQILDFLQKLKISLCVS